MHFFKTPIDGVFIIKPQPQKDDRGYFCRTYCQTIFNDHHLVTQWVQISTSFNHKAGQCRGMHFQKDPFGETKLIRCTKGSIIDALIDVRPESTTYQCYFNAILSDENQFQIYVPKGIAHGYKTLQDNTELLYMMDQFYSAEHASEISIDEKYFDLGASFLPLTHHFCKMK